VGRVLIAAGCRAVAAFVIFAAGLLAAWVALFRVGHPALPLAAGKAVKPGTSYSFVDRCAVGTNYCDAVRPGWTIPVAIAILLVGVVVAAAVHRSRRGAPSERRAVDYGRSASSKKRTPSIGFSL
jgi:hypothetical protein